MMGNLSLKNRLVGFRQAVDGSFATMFALTLPVLILGIGVAIDISQGTLNRSKLQDSLDNVTLAYASTYMQTADISKANTSSESSMNLNIASLKGADMQNWQIDPVTRNGDEYVIRGRAFAKQSNNLMGIFGKPTMDITVTSEAVIKITKISTVIVPDISWSMRNNMGLVKNAMNDFASEMYSLLPEFQSEFQMGIVPYAGSVNVSALGSNALNLLRDWDYSGELSRDTWHKQYFRSGNACNEDYVRERLQIQNVGGSAQINTLRSSWQNVHIGFTQDPATGLNTIPQHQWRCESEGVIKSEPWTGCIQMLSGDYSPDVTIPNNSRGPIPLSLKDGTIPHCPVSDSSMQANITSEGQFRTITSRLRSAYSTAHDVGLTWGARLLEPNWAGFLGLESRPWDDEDYPKFLVYFSDGASVDVGYTFDDYNGRTPGVIDNNVRHICSYLKDRGVIIYGISYTRTSKPEAIEIVEDCASPNLHYNATSSDVSDVFKAIARDIKLKGIRLSD